MEAKNLPYSNSKEFELIKDKKDFYICLITINSGFSRFKRKMIPTKITHIDYSTYQPFLVSEKETQILYDTNIYYFDTYEKCATHFNFLIDQVDQMKKKHDDMLKLKVNVRELKLKRVLKEETSE